MIYIKLDRNILSVELLTWNGFKHYYLAVCKQALKNKVANKLFAFKSYV